MGARFLFFVENVYAATKFLHGHFSLRVRNVNVIPWYILVFSDRLNDLESQECIPETTVYM